MTKSLSAGVPLRIQATIAGLVLLFLSGCHKRYPHLDLNPPNNKPVLSVQISDAEEAAILQQQVATLEPLRIEGGAFLFHASQEALTKMRQAGYEPQQQNATSSYRRVVEVVKTRGFREDRLMKLGVRLINREPDHWVVSGTLEQLEAVQAAGFRLRSLRREPRPRFIRVAVPDNGASVQRLSEMGVDIHSVEPEKAVGKGEAKTWHVFGGAFDSVIDAVKQAGFAASPFVPSGNK